MLIFTKLVLIPVLLSYIGVSPKAAAARAEASTRPSRPGVRDGRACGRAGSPDRARACALIAIVAAALLVGAALLSLRTQLKIGDLDAGAPELRADSRYNRDNAYITRHYGLSSDLFAVMVKTPTERLRPLRGPGRGRPPRLGAASTCRACRR